MDIDLVRKHLERVCNWEIYPLELREKHLRELAIDVPDLVKEVDRLTQVIQGATDAQRVEDKRNADEVATLKLQIDELKKEEQDTRNQYTALKHSAASRISELEACLGRANENVSLLLGKLRDQLDGIVKDWGEAFAKHGFILHPGLTPEQNAAEWKAQMQMTEKRNDQSALGQEMTPMERILMEAVNEFCSCGGAGPENGCVVCKIWHKHVAQSRKV
jgi:chromosome segregation ATPase